MLFKTTCTEHRVYNTGTTIPDGTKNSFYSSVILNHFHEVSSMCTCYFVYYEGHTVRYSFSLSIMTGILSDGISITVLKGFMGTSSNDHLPPKQVSASSWTE